jgi:hypothetical protein
MTLYNHDDRYAAPHCYVVKTRIGYDARAYRVRSDDWNALGYIVEETSHRTEAAARKSAARMAKAYGGTLAE